LNRAIADCEYLTSGPDTYEEGAVGKGKQAPRPLDPMGHDAHADLLLKGVVDTRLERQRILARRWCCRARLRKRRDRQRGKNGSAGYGEQGNSREMHGKH